MIDLDTPVGVLDIGSETSKFIIFSISGSDNQVQILANTTIHTKGVKKGIISDLDKLSETVKKLIGTAEEKSKTQISKIYISINPLNFAFISFCQSKYIGDFEIDEKNDVQFLVNSGINLFKSSYEDKKIIHVFNYNLRLDKLNLVDNPCGLNADSLENDMSIICCNKNIFKNYQKLIKKSYINSEDFISSSYSLACTIYYENLLADIFLVIDFGHEKTSLSIFKNGNFIYSSSIAIGSWHITNDISKCLNLSYEIADKLKKEYASCIPENFQENGKFLDIDNDQVKSFKKVSNNILNKITNSRAEEIIDLINNEISSLNLGNSTLNKIIFTGKGSKLKGFQELLIKKTKIKTLLFEKFSLKVKSDNNFIDDYDVCLSIISLLQNRYKSEITTQKKQKNSFFDKFYTIFK
jgi:cell division protein FtsA